MLPRQLNELLYAMCDQAKLEPEQRADIHENVRPYLFRVAVNARINPREVKRFINGYTLQTIVRRSLNPAVVLALQTIAFRFDWQDAYDAINSDPDQFISALRRYRTGEQNAFQGSLPALERRPAELSDYLASPLAEPLAAAGSLTPYLSSLRSSHGVDPGFADALGALGRFERALATALGAPGVPDALTGRWEELQGSSSEAGLLREQSVGIRLGVFRKLLDAYRLDPPDSMELLRQAQDETEQLRAAMRFARDFARDDRR